MLKTKKTVAKKFKLTGSGKLRRRKPGSGHLLRNKSTKQRRRMRQDESVSEGMTKRLLRALPFGL